jgi:hypothetical protein
MLPANEAKALLYFRLALAAFVFSVYRLRVRRGPSKMLRAIVSHA